MTQSCANLSMFLWSFPQFLLCFRLCFFALIHVQHMFYSSTARLLYLLVRDITCFPLRKARGPVCFHEGSFLRTASSTWAEVQPTPVM